MLFDEPADGFHPFTGARLAYGLSFGIPRMAPFTLSPSRFTLPCSRTSKATNWRGAPGCIQVDVAGDQEVAGADGGGAEPALKRAGYSRASIPAFQLFGQRLVLPARMVVRFFHFRFTGGGFV